MTCLQDVYRRLSSPRALQGMLRIRTSPELKVSRAYGQLFQDEQYDNLVHITACSPHSSFAFDFQYSNAGGFATSADAPPMVQMVFQYSVLVLAHPGPGQGDLTIEQQQPRYVLLRQGMSYSSVKVIAAVFVMGLHWQRPFPHAVQNYVTDGERQLVLQQLYSRAIVSLKLIR